MLVGRKKFYHEGNSLEFNHKSVMLEECIQGLNIKPEGIYVDGTMGGAGHSKEIAKKILREEPFVFVIVSRKTYDSQKELFIQKGYELVTEETGSWYMNEMNRKIAAEEKKFKLDEKNSIPQIAEFTGKDEISDAASAELSAIRKKIARAGSKLRDTLDKMIKSEEVQKSLQDNIITMRDGRYVLPVKAEHRGKIQGLIHSSSATGQTIFIEPMSVVEANNDIKLLESQEQEEIEKRRAEAFPDCSSISITDMRSWTFEKDDNANPQISQMVKKYVEHFEDFKKAYAAEDRNAVSDERWSHFTREQIREKGDSLDIGLIRDDSILDYEDLPDPIESGEEVIGKLSEAMDLIQEVVNELKSLAGDK